MCQGVAESSVPDLSRKQAGAQAAERDAFPGGVTLSCRSLLHFVSVSISRKWGYSVYQDPNSEIIVVRHCGGLKSDPAKMSIPSSLEPCRYLAGLRQDYFADSLA